MDAAEIASRLKRAAEIEIGSINYLERLSASGGAGLTLIPAEIRAQAEALGDAYRVMVVLAQFPGMLEALLASASAPARSAERSPPPPLASSAS